MSSSAASPVVGGPDIPRRGRAALTPLLVVLGVLAALIAGGLTVASGGQHYAALGLPDAGSFTEENRGGDEDG